MSEEQVAGVVDLNRAPPEVLEQLPGIGPALARRIVEARPFTTPEDLVRVSGIGSVLLERLRPYFTVSPPEAVGEGGEEKEPPAPLTMPSEREVAVSEVSVSPSEEIAADSAGPGVQAEAAAGLTEPESALESAEIASPAVPSDAGGGDEGIPAGAASQETKPEAASLAKPEAEKLVTRRDLIAWVVGSNLITLFLALLLALLFLGLVNGTLRFASMAQFRQFRAEVAVLSERVDRLESDLETVRTRVEALEGLNGRVSGLERETAALKSTLDQAQADIQAIQTLVKGFDQRLAAVEATSARFGRFLEGLRQLLSETQAPTEGGP